MHDLLIQATAPASELTVPRSLSIRGYRIGLLLTESEAECAPAQLQSAAERMGYRLLPASDAAQLAPSAVDFVIATADLADKPAGLPTFGFIREANAGFWDDDEWLSRVAKFDGYLTASDSVRRFLGGFGSGARAEPLVGFFELTPERQFFTCQLEKLIGSSAFRLCSIGTAGERQEQRTISSLASRPYLRRYGTEASEPSGFGARPTGGQSAQRLFAAFGGGLVTMRHEQRMDAAALYRLCEIVSVGAVAICPDIAWIRRHLRDTVWYYPANDPSASVEAIDGAIEAITGNPAGAAQQARAAKALFDQILAAEVMLRNTVRLYEEWRERELQSAAAPGKGLIRHAFAPSQSETARPLVSLIFTVKNGMPFVSSAIESVRRQSYRNFQLIVQDCMSDDGTSELLTGIDDIEVDLAREPDGGIGDAVSRALSRCRGPIIGSIDSDNLLHPGALDRVAEHFARSPADAAAYGAVEMIDEAGAVLDLFRPARFNLLRLLDCELVPPWSTAFFRRETLIDAFRPGAALRTCADFSTWLHVAHLPIGYIDEPLGSTRLNRNSMTCNVEAYEQFCLDKIKALNQYLASCKHKSLRTALLLHGKVGIYCWAAESIAGLDRSRNDLVQSFLGRARAIAPASSRLASAEQRIDAFRQQ